MAQYRILISYSLIILLGVTFTIYYVIDYHIDSLDLYKKSGTAELVYSNTNLSLLSYSIIPNLIHRTWKTNEQIPPTLNRWSKMCERINPDFRFHTYDDVELKEFVAANYPEYLPLFQVLKGVYMADMARLIIIYHYGGIYLDLDFYCHRPYRCLVQFVHESITDRDLANKIYHHNSMFRSPIMFLNHSIEYVVDSFHSSKDLLVVSREPAAHAILMRNKSRVIIQDFFLATPKHPFIKWILSDRMKNFHPEKFTGASRGPFSYSIEKDIDRYIMKVVEYHQHTHTTSQRKSDLIHRRTRKQRPDEQRQLIDKEVNETSLFTSLDFENGLKSIIIELEESITHPLLDSTNSRLHSTCTKFHDNHLSLRNEIVGKNETVTDHQSMLNKNEMDYNSKDFKQVCDRVMKGNYFQPSSSTILVHMWSHVYLGWNVIRMIYNYQTYQSVEKSLPPVYTCQ